MQWICVKHLRCYSNELNREKCLGFLVSQMGIEVNPKKIEVNLKMRLPKDHKDIQNLIKKVIVLSKFIFEGVRQMPSIFELMKKGKRLKWLEECKAVF